MDEPLRLDRYERPADFLAAASPWLEQREAEHNLILGIGSTARDHPEMYDPPYLATVTAGERLVAAALRTPPWNLILSEVDDAGALDLLAADLADHDLPGVIAAPDVATGFALRWAATTGGRFAVGMEERIFELTEVIAPLAVSGSMRAATAEDRPLLVDWITAFGREALGEGDASRVAGCTHLACWPLACRALSVSVSHFSPCSNSPPAVSTSAQQVPQNVSASGCWYRLM